MIEAGIPHVVLFDTSGDDDREINKELSQQLSVSNNAKVDLPPVCMSMALHPYLSPGVYSFLYAFSFQVAIRVFLEVRAHIHPYSL